MAYIPAWAVKPLIALAVAALLSGTGVAYGWSKGKASEAKASAAMVAKANKRASDAATALSAAAVRLSADARLFRTINATTAANLQAADRVIAYAQRQSDGLQAQVIQSNKRLAQLQRAAAAERDTCTDGRAPICGTPLR